MNNEETLIPGPSPRGRREKERSCSSLPMGEGLGVRVLSVHQPQYIPWLGYFDKIKNSDLFVYLDCCQYKHREFQNRNRIWTTNGELWLAVPVLVKGRREQRIKDVMINNDSRWAESHWRSIKTVYAKAPYFDEHEEVFSDIYLKKEWRFLMDLNIEITSYLLKCFDINTPVRLESDIGTESLSTERIAQLCEKTGSNVYLSGSGAKAYLDEKYLLDKGIETKWQDFQHPEYLQFNNNGNFVPYMSALDCIFNCEL